MVGKLVNGGDPSGEDFPQGPAVGDMLPAFALPDQSGRLVHYRPDGGQRALVLFHRSADW